MDASQKLTADFMADIQVRTRAYAEKLTAYAVKEMVQRLTGSPVLMPPDRTSPSAVNGQPLSPEAERRLANPHAKRIKARDAVQPATPALIFEAMDAGYTSCNDISRAIGSAYNQTRKELDTLRTLGQVRMEGQKRGSKWLRVQVRS